MKQFQDVIGRFARQRVAVAGDVMLDRYIFGRVERISPEAPIPVVEWQSNITAPGGAANAAANCVSLGGQCAVFGVVGRDQAGRDLKAAMINRQLAEQHLRSVNRPTTEKTRIIGNNQQIVRIDRETTADLPPAIGAALAAEISSRAESFDALIVCDYAKGVLTSELMDCLRAIAHSRAIPLLADVKPKHFETCHHLTFMTPNKKELAGMVNATVATVADAKRHGLALAKRLETNILVTLSEDGMVLVEHRAGRAIHLPTRAQEVADVSGAGDTVIATLALAMAAGADLVCAATLANHAASVVVSKLGTATVTPAELRQTFVR